MERSNRRAISARLCSPAAAKDRSGSRAPALHSHRNRDRLSAARARLSRIRLRLSPHHPILRAHFGAYAMADQLVLYTNPMSRGRVARWRLEEIGEPYKVELVDHASTMKGPAYLAINPMGKVP